MPTSVHTPIPRIYIDCDKKDNEIAIRKINLLGDPMHVTPFRIKHMVVWEIKGRTAWAHSVIKAYQPQG